MKPSSTNSPPATPGTSSFHLDSESATPRWLVGTLGLLLLSAWPVFSGVEGFRVQALAMMPVGLGSVWSALRWPLRGQFVVDGGERVLRMLSPDERSWPFKGLKDLRVSWSSAAFASGVDGWTFRPFALTIRTPAGEVIELQRGREAELKRILHDLEALGVGLSR